ncbi:MAG TPA: hypothetical protein VF407_23375 [Polyangiaceae bacterium]
MKLLDDVLRYENEEVVHRFAADHGISYADASEIFLETKRWLWLSATHRSLALPLFSEARAIDEMWHTFLLFSRDYATFCDESFGFFVHHAPRTKREKDEWDAKIAADPEGARAERREKLRAAYLVVADELGTATLKKWCEEFPARFRFAAAK